MNTKRKISVRKIIQTVVTLIVTTGCIVAISAASKIQDAKKVKAIDIQIKNSQYKFVDETEVKNLLLNNRHVDITRTSISKLDLNQMEQIVDANPWISDAQVYIDNRKVLHVFITQRVPVARLFEQNGNSYYIDHTLSTMPLSDRYIHYSTVVTNVPVLGNDSMSKDLKAQIAAMVRFIDRDTFWSAQVSQVIVTDDRTFELVPVLGDQRILFGDTTSMSRKFSNLFLFYKKVQNRIGWNKYQVLDVRFEGQVVASPALQWKMPANNAMSNMDWVKSIIGNEAKPTEPDMPGSLTTAKPALVPATASAHIAKPEPKKTVAAPAEKKPEPTPVAAAKKPEPKKAEVKKPEVKKETVQAKPIEKKETKKAEPKQDKQKTSNEEKPAPKYIYQGNNNN